MVKKRWTNHRHLSRSPCTFTPESDSDSSSSCFYLAKSKTKSRKRKSPGGTPGANHVHHHGLCGRNYVDDDKKSGSNLCSQETSLVKKVSRLASVFIQVYERLVLHYLNLFWKAVSAKRLIPIQGVTLESFLSFLFFWCGRLEATLKRLSILWMRTMVKRKWGVS